MIEATAGAGVALFALGMLVMLGEAIGGRDDAGPWSVLLIVAGLGACLVAVLAIGLTEWLPPGWAVLNAAGAVVGATGLVAGVAVRTRRRERERDERNPGPSWTGAP